MNKKWKYNKIFIIENAKIANSICDIANKSRAIEKEKKNRLTINKVEGRELFEKSRYSKMQTIGISIDSSPGSQTKSYQIEEIKLEKIVLKTELIN